MLSKPKEHVETVRSFESLKDCLLSGRIKKVRITKITGKSVARNQTRKSLVHLNSVENSHRFEGSEGRQKIKLKQLRLSTKSKEKLDSFREVDPLTSFRGRIGQQLRREAP